MPTYQKKLTPEEQEIRDAIDKADEAKWWSRQILIAAMIIYTAGFVTGLVPTAERASAPLFMLALLLLGANLLQDLRVAKLRRAAKQLINTYRRKKAVPLYHDMLEKFADQPHLHIHLSDDGTIQITDRRKEKPDGRADR